MKKASILVLCILIILSVTACGGDAWPKNGLGAMLPKPSSGTVKIVTNSDSFYATVDKSKEDEFAKYVSACKEKGYTVDAKEDGNTYDAFNEDGYHLELTSYTSNNNMQIKLDPPIELGSLRWPSGEIGKIIPQPDSKKGKTESEKENGFSLYVGDTTLDQFDAYADKCADAGFNVAYEKGDKYYRADNKDGYHLSLEYLGFNIMSINVSKNESKDSNTATAKDKGTDNNSSSSSSSSKAVSAEEKPASSAADKNTTGSNEIRPDIKEAIDSYESFIDEYCEFMENYDSSNVQQITKYTSLVAKELEMTQKFNALENNDLNDAEENYYIEVQLRCSRKLNDASKNIN